MSPEQYLVEWNCLVDGFTNTDAKVQKYNSTTAAWDNFGGASLVSLPVADNDELNFSLRDITVGTDTVSRYIIETDLDWTASYKYFRN